MKKKILVIGDLHLENPYKGYLEAQHQALERIIKTSQPDVAVFLGDIFHHRNPSVEVLTKTVKFFDRLCDKYYTHYFILRGNHDSANKSDDGMTVLNLLRSPVKVFEKDSICKFLESFMIPHYENEDKTIEALKVASHFKDLIVFGHFGYDGCINTGQYFNFKVKKDHIKNRTILGHIHRYAQDDHITILGTPWSTNFGECDYKHYVGEIWLDTETYSFSELNLVEVTFGPRYYACPFEALEQMKDEIMDPEYYTILRVIMNKFSDEHTNDIREKILNEYKVAYVDLKFQPVLDKKLSNRLSNYEPAKLEAISNEVVDKYIEENATSIPIEVLKQGLEEIKAYEDKESME